MHNETSFTGFLFDNFFLDAHMLIIYTCNVQLYIDIFTILC